MSLRGRIATGLAVLLVLLSAGAGVAQAATYPQQIAAALRSNPVFVDANAKPSLSGSQVDQLRAQIKQTGKPIYLILTDVSQLRGNSPAQLMTAVHNAFGGSYVIAVSTSKGFTANGFLPASVANQPGQIAKQAVANHKTDPFGAYSEFITQVAKIKVPGTATSGSSSNTSTVTNQTPDDSGFPTWATVLLIIGALGVVGGIIAFIVSRVKRKQRNDRRDEDQVRLKGRLQGRLEQLSTDLVALDDKQLDAHEGAKGHYVSADTARSNAEQALARNDLEDAATNLDKGERHVARINEAIDGVSPGDSSSVHDFVASTDEVSPRKDRRRKRRRPNSDNASSGSGVRVQRGDGTTVVVNHNDYRSGQASGYPHYYSGGYYDGRYWAAGYYPVPFWVDSPYDRGDYNDGYADGVRHEDRVDQQEGNADGGQWGGDTSDPVVEGTADGGTWGSSSDSGSSSGGDDTPVADNSGGGDWGNSDSGSSSSDGGSTDSGGGGSSDGGSWS